MDLLYSRDSRERERERKDKREECETNSTVEPDPYLLRLPGVSGNAIVRPRESICVHFEARIIHKEIVEHIGLEKGRKNMITL